MPRKTRLHRFPAPSSQRAAELLELRHGAFQRGGRFDLEHNAHTGRTGAVQPFVQVICSSEKNAPKLFIASGRLVLF